MRTPNTFTIARWAVLLYALIMGYLVTPTLRAQQTHLDYLLNYTATNFHYGDQQEQFKGFRKPVWGVQAGLAFQAGITPALSLQSEFYFMMKGGALKANNPLGAAATKTRLFSLELPLLARIHLGRFYANAGPSMAYNLAGRIKTEGQEGLPDQVNSRVFSGTEASFRRWEVGLQLGMGYELPLRQSRIAFDLRYQHGLSNLSRNAEVYNRNWVFNILISAPWGHNPLAATSRS
ncbi:MAG: porin family protein [Bacteroidota bacterium]